MHPLHYHLDWVQFILSTDHDIHHIVQEDDDGARSTIGVSIFVWEFRENIVVTIRRSDPCQCPVHCHVGVEWSVLGLTIGHIFYWTNTVENIFYLLLAQQHNHIFFVITELDAYFPKNATCCLMISISWLVSGGQEDVPASSSELSFFCRDADCSRR